MEKSNEEVLSSYNEEMLNYLSDMDDNEKANFLHHMEVYAEDRNGKIELNKLENGEYLQHMMSNKKDYLKKFKDSIEASIFFSIWSGMCIANTNDIGELVNKYNDNIIKQFLLASDHVLPISIALGCLFLTSYNWFHYSLCNDTINSYQRILK